MVKLSNRLISKISSYAPPSLFFIFIIWMIVQADLDKKNIIMEIGRAVPYGDKIGHFILFGILALLVNMALSFKQVKTPMRKFHLGSVLVLTFAVIEECTQLAFSTRTFDLIDMLFDLLGIGILSSVAFRKYVIKKLRVLLEYLDKNLCVD